MSTSSDQLRFEDWLQRIDELLGQYDPGDLEPQLPVRDIVEQRAAQRPLLERVVELATSALLDFPRNSELLRRRAFALCRIVSDELDYPRAEEGIMDLKTIMAFDPNALRSGLQLVDELFTFGGVENADAAVIAAELASRAESMMLEARVLQVRALIHDQRADEARQLGEHWLQLFPDCEELEAALQELTEVRGTMQ